MRMKKQNVRTLSLIVCTFTYLLIGAAIFDALESDNEAKNAQVLQEMERMIMDRYGIVYEDYRLMEIMVLKGAPHYAGKQWKFAGAFYYATTVLTTIGYGHSTPHTVGGKLFTMAYALVGIPLGLVMFQSIGERLNNFSSFVIRNVKRVLKYENVEASETNLILVVTAITTMTISGGAAAFSKYEGWTYFDSIYYCFVTLTTIGFGDMVALQQDNALTDKPEYVAFVLIFILFGLAIVAACLNLLVLRLVTLNTEDERRDEAAAVKAAQGAVRLEGDVITANGSILSGQLPREQGGLGGAGGLAGSLIHLEGDSKSVCSCSCQAAHNRCFPCFASMRRSGRTGRPKRHKPVEYPPFASGGGSGRGAVSVVMSGGVGRSYGALSSTGTFSLASMDRVGVIQHNQPDDVFLMEPYNAAASSFGAAGGDPEQPRPFSQQEAEYFELQKTADFTATPTTRMRSGVVYASSARSSIVTTTASPSRLYSGSTTVRSGLHHHRTSDRDSPTPDRVLTRSRRHGSRAGGGINFTVAGLVRRLRQFRRRLVSTFHTGHRPNARQRVSMARSKKSSQAAAKQRACMVQQQQHTGNVAVAIATALPSAAHQLVMGGGIGGGVSNIPSGVGGGETSESIDFVDVPLNDNPLLSWSTTTVLSEKRASF